MFRVVQVVCAAAAIAVAAFFFSLTFIAWKYLPPILTHTNGTLTRLEGVESKANATLVNLDKATAVWAKASTDQAQDIAGLITDAHGLIGSTDYAMASVRLSADSLAAELDALHKTTDGATGTLSQARTDLQTLNTSIAATQPLLAAYARAGNDLDGLIEDPNWRAMVFHSAGALDSADGILADFKRAADKATDDYLTPKPWWKKAFTYAGDGFDVTAFLARHSR